MIHPSDLKREQPSPQQRWHGCGQRGVMPASKKTFSRAKYLVDAQGSEGVRVQTIPESGPTKLAQPKRRLGRELAQKWPLVSIMCLSDDSSECHFVSVKMRRRDVTAE
jgi:hypothetical protein